MQTRDDEGKFENKYPDEDVKDAIRKLENPTAPAIQRETDIPKRTVNRKLEKMEERGEVKREVLSVRAIVWHLTPEGREKLEA